MIRNQRQGSIAVLSVFMMLAFFVIAAFVINLGSLVNRRAELQNIADASAKSASWTMAEEYGTAGFTDLATNSAQEMVDVASVATAIHSVFSPEAGDVAYGRFSWNKVSHTWEAAWDTSPTNLVRVALARVPNRDNALDVFLSPFLSKSMVEINVHADAAMFPATAFEYNGKNLPILPIAVDLDSWIALEQGGGSDRFRWDESTGAVSRTSDGVPELKIFPLGDPDLPAGNRATLALGGSENSAAKLGRQIRNGLNETDLAHHGGGFSVADGPLYLEGDPGISASIERDLIAITGEIKIIPLFTEVHSPGATSVYTIVKFVGVRVMYVNLRGARRYKELIVQPASLVIDDATTNGKMPLLENELGTVFAPPSLIWNPN